MIVERDIVRALRRKAAARRAWRASRAIDHRRQRLDVERDRFGRILGLRDRLGDHAGDRIADEAHLVGRQRRARRVLDRRAVAALERQIAFEPAIGRRDPRRYRRPSTPGIALAAAVSMPRMMPWASRLRTITA